MARKVLKYAASTSTFGIQYQRDAPERTIKLYASSDAEYAGQTSDGKSITGWAVWIAGGVISAKSKKQGCHARRAWGALHG